MIFMEYKQKEFVRYLLSDVFGMQIYGNNGNSSVYSWKTTNTNR